MRQDTFWQGKALAFLFLVAISCSPGIGAQELVPRSYWPAPKDTTVLLVGYQYSTGDVVTDPTLPLADVDSQVHTGTLGLQHTLSLFGRTANLQFVLPYVEGDTTGLVNGQFRDRHISAFADPRIQLSINLRGAPSMDREAFQELRADPHTIIGASLMIQPPTGAYEPDKLINAGTNRWAAKLGAGAIWPIRPTWLFEVDLGAWFFTDNDEFLGQTREQDPIMSVEFHLVKRIRPGFWASLDANYYYGGKSTVGDLPSEDLQRNSRFGGTLVFPFQHRHAIRLAYSTGVVTESGGDYDVYSINYAYLW